LVETIQAYNIQYGFIEASIKLPYGYGLPNRIPNFIQAISLNYRDVQSKIDSSPAKKRDSE